VEKRGKSCGRVRLGVIDNVSADVLTAFVDNHLGDGETAHTDGWRGYAQLGNTGYRHIINTGYRHIMNTGYRHIISVLSKLDQTAAEVLPRVHLIFSLLKRWILGTHQGLVSLKLSTATSRSLPSASTAAAPAGLLTAPSGSSPSP
jgi:ISXO2-like transposase domain